MTSVTEALSPYLPLPESALFMGTVKDDLPLLLNFDDPIPGPLLVVSDHPETSRAFLRNIAQSINATKHPDYAKFAVITDNPAEWVNTYSENNLGVLQSSTPEAGSYIQTLAAWAHENKQSGSALTLLLDNFDFNNLNVEGMQSLRWLLLRGPARKTWPIVATSSAESVNMGEWLQAFRTRIFGTISPAYLGMLDALSSPASTLDAWYKFTIKEGENWILFDIPNE